MVNRIRSTLSNHNGIVHFLLIIVLAILIVGVLVSVKNLRDSKDFRSRAQTAPTTFLETFNGAPSTPLARPNITALKNWDIQVSSRDDSTWTTLEPMVAHHGPNCEPPIDAAGKIVGHQLGDMTIYSAPNFKEAADAGRGMQYQDAVFQCKDHIMTSIHASGYGIVYLTPPVLVDFSQGPATIRFDMTTYQASKRDWMRVIVTKWEDNLVIPSDCEGVDCQGNPDNSIFFKQGTENFFWADITRDGVNTNLNPSKCGGCGGWDSVLTQSPQRRDKFEMVISKTHIKFCMPKDPVDNMPREEICWANDPINPPLTWDKGVFSFGHHSYTPTKTLDCESRKNEMALPGFPPECQPNTWHWDNVEISPAKPFTIIQTEPYKRTVHAGTTPEMTFRQPAPTNAFLRFAGTGNLQVSFNGGTSYQAVQPKPPFSDQSKFATYWVPMPAGVTKVLFKGTNTTVNWRVKDAHIWSQTTGPTPTPCVGAGCPTPTPTPPEITPTLRPTPTLTPTTVPTPTRTPSPVPTPTPCVKLGDMDQDCDIDITDLSIYLNRYDTKHTSADLNGDGQVTIADLSVFLSRFGQ